MQGTVQWFSGPKGFGFIKPDGEEKDMFVHHTSIDMEGYRTLKQGDRVTFDVETGPKGLPQAVFVKVIK